MKDDKIRQLVIKAKKREPDPFTELMQYYMPNMYRCAIAILKNDADVGDAIGDTILACWEKINSLKNISHFKTWMTKILINKCYDIRRQREKIIGLEEYQEQAVCDEYNMELKEALYSLDEKYRLIMILYYCEGYPIKDIADILKIPKSTVQTRLQRGRERLASYYREII